MRRVFLLLSVATAVCLLTPTGTIAEDCSCQSLVTTTFTCFGCGAKVQVNVCQNGSGNSCQACQKDAIDIQCCPNEFIGSDGYCGSCGEKCEQLSVPKVSGASLHRFYTPACTGGLKTIVVALK